MYNVGDIVRITDNELKKIKRCFSSSWNIEHKNFINKCDNSWVIYSSYNENSTGDIYYELLNGIQQPGLIGPDDYKLPTVVPHDGLILISTWQSHKRDEKIDKLLNDRKY